MSINRHNFPYWLVFAIILATAGILYSMGRVLICKCGTVKLWYFALNTSEGSQHLFDWYSPSHLIRGILFYAILWLVARRLDIIRDWQAAL